MKPPRRTSAESIMSTQSGLSPSAAVPFHMAPTGVFELESSSSEIVRKVYAEAYSGSLVDVSAISIQIESIPIQNFLYKTWAQDESSYIFGRVRVNKDDAESMMVHIKNFQRMDCDDLSQVSISEVCSALQVAWHATHYFPALQLLSIIKAHREFFVENMHGATGILFPGVVLANSLGEWCVPAVHFKDNHTHIHLVPIKQQLGGYEIFLIKKP